MIQQQDRQQQQNEQQMQHEREQQQIRETRKIISGVRKGTGKCKKKKVHQHSIGLVGENRQRSNNTDFFGRTFGMKMILDRFRDGWHKSVMYMYGRQQIAARFGDGVS